MMQKRGFLGLPERDSTLLILGFSIFLCLTGIKLVLSPSFDLKVADTQLKVNSSASKLEALANELDEQARILEQKDKAYKDLESTYQKYLENKKGSIDLGKKIEAIDKLPETGDITKIEEGISEIEDDLLEVTKEE